MDFSLLVLIDVVKGFETRKKSKLECKLEYLTYWMIHATRMPRILILSGFTEKRASFSLNCVLLLSSVKIHYLLLIKFYVILLLNFIV